MSRKKLEAQFQEKKMRRLEQQNEELRDMNASLEVVDRLEQQNEELRAKNASLEVETSRVCTFTSSTLQHAVYQYIRTCKLHLLVHCSICGYNILLLLFRL